MLRDIKLLLTDILSSGNKAVSKAKDASLEDLTENEDLQAYLLWHIQVVGEAASKLPSEYRNQHPEIPWQKMIGMRNVIVHGYFTLKWEIVWDAATNHLPTVLPQIQDELEQQ